MKVLWLSPTTLPSDPLVHLSQLRCISTIQPLQPLRPSKRLQSQQLLLHLLWRLESEKGLEMPDSFTSFTYPIVKCMTPQNYALFAAFLHFSGLEKDAFWLFALIFGRFFTYRYNLVDLFIWTLMSKKNIAVVAKYHIDTSWTATGVKLSGFRGLYWSGTSFRCKDCKKISNLIYFSDFRIHFWMQWSLYEFDTLFLKPL